MKERFGVFVVPNKVARPGGPERAKYHDRIVGMALDSTVVFAPRRNTPGEFRYNTADATWRPLIVGPYFGLRFLRYFGRTQTIIQRPSSTKGVSNCHDAGQELDPTGSLRLAKRGREDLQVDDHITDFRPVGSRTWLPYGVPATFRLPADVAVDRIPSTHTIVGCGPNYPPIAMLAMRGVMAMEPIAQTAAQYRAGEIPAELYVPSGALAA